MMLAISTFAMLSACGIDDIKPDPSAGLTAVSEQLPGDRLGTTCSCTMTVSDIITEDYTAHVNELVQINMLGKAAPDVVHIFLPVADESNKGQPIEIATINSGGAEDGSILRLVGDGQTIYPTGNQYLDSFNREVLFRLISNGSGWVVTSGW
jgi:hypothetical protein